jgi:hypothetical protein
MTVAPPNVPSLALESDLARSGLLADDPAHLASNKILRICRHLVGADTSTHCLDGTGSWTRSVRRSHAPGYALPFSNVDAFGPVGILYVKLSLRHFRLARSWSLSLGAGAPRRARRINSEQDPRWRPFRFSKSRRCSTGASRRFSVLAISAAGRSMALALFGATGSRHIAGGMIAIGRGALRQALASTFPAGAIVVFIPWCRGAEARAANQGKQGRLLASRPCARIVYKEPASKGRLRISNGTYSDSILSSQEVARNFDVDLFSIHCHICRISRGDGRYPRLLETCRPLRSGPRFCSPKPSSTTISTSWL